MALTLTQINAVNPAKIYRLPLILNKDNWGRFTLPVALPNPIVLPFDENIRDIMDANGIKNGKGIYMFRVNPNLPFIPHNDYLIYIGRVTQNNTFFKRFYEYVQAIGDNSVKRNRMIMTNLWYGMTDVYFYDLSSANDDDIKEVEKQLVDYIAPPLNEQFYISEVRDTRRLY